MSNVEENAALNEAGDNKNSSNLTTYLIISLAISFIYVASIFPVAYYFRSRGIGPSDPLTQIIEVVYGPIIWAMEHIGVFENIMNWIAERLGVK